MVVLTVVNTESEGSMPLILNNSYYTRHLKTFTEGFGKNKLSFRNTIEGNFMNQTNLQIFPELFETLLRFHFDHRGAHELITLCKITSH